MGKGFSKLTGFFRDTIGAAADAEKANQGLDAALFTTGRTTAQLGDHFKAYADQLMRSTTYDDEAIKGAQALLLQLTSLDKDGLDRATKGAIGLATVFRMDLTDAAQKVGLWMEGNLDRIKKYGIHVDETASKEKQQSQILDQLGVYYQRAESATGTFSGTLSQLKNVFGEAQEKIGEAVTKNEAFQKTIKAIREEIQFFIDSGQAEKLGKKLSGILDLAILGAKGLFKELKEGPMGMGDVLAEQIVNPLEGVHAQAIKNVKTITEFRDSLKWIKPTIDEMGKAIEGGATSWGEYRYKIAQADAEFEKNKKTLGGWMDKAFGLIGINSEIAKSFDVSTKGTVHQNEMTEKQKKLLEELTKVHEQLMTRGLSPMQKETRDIIKNMETLDEGYKGGLLSADKYRDGMGRLQKQLYGLNDVLGVTLPGSTRKMWDVMDQAVGPMTMDAVRVEFSWRTAAAAAALEWQKKMAEISQYTDVVMQGMTDIFNQYFTNKNTAIDNDYIKQKEAIEKSKISEEDKNKAFEKLDADYAAKKRDAKRKEFIVHKITEATETGISGARAAVEALPNFILAALIGAFTVAKTAFILAQPVPLATGGVFTRPTRFMTEGGGYYEAERGEMMIPPGKGGGGVSHIHVHIPPNYFSGERPQEFIIKTTQQALNRGLLGVPAKVIG